MTAHTSYRPDIDGLRAIAVLIVVFCHAGLGFPGGYVGVDVFFVISGYLITKLILKDLEQGTFSLTDFWERRIRRILPALLVVIAVTLLGGWFLLMQDAYASLGKSVAALTMLISNFQFWRDTGYFDTAAEQKPLLHTWSLAVEEQFYLFAPLFLLLLARFGRLRFAIPFLLVGMILSFALSVYGSYFYAEATFYLLPTRAWELLVGALLGITPALKSEGLSRLRGLLSVTGLTMILLPCFVYDQHTRFPGAAALLPVIGTALIIFGGSSGNRFPLVNEILALQPFVFVGLISYSLYLWHWPLLAFARYRSVYPLGIVERVVVVLLGLVAATASWRFVETPFRRRLLLVSRGKLFTVAGGALLALLVIGSALYYYKGFEERLPPAARLYASFAMDRVVHDLTIDDIPTNLVRYGPSDSPPKVLVWGDSHAMSILPAIEALARETNTVSCAATHTANAPVIGYYYRDKWALNERSLPFNAAVLEYVRSARIPKVVLVARWHLYVNDSSEFLAALMDTVAALQATGASVYFVCDVPRFNFTVPRALALCSLKGSDLSELGMIPEDYERQNHFHEWLLPRLREARVQILDPIPAIQTRTHSIRILPFDSGGSFFLDQHHLSKYGALAIKSVFLPVFESGGSQ